MKIKSIAVLALAIFALAACGLRDNPAVPPAKDQLSPPTEPAPDKD